MTNGLVYQLLNYGHDGYRFTLEDHYPRSCQNSICVLALRNKISRKKVRWQLDAPSFSVFSQMGKKYSVLSAAITVACNGCLDRIEVEIQKLGAEINMPMDGVNPLLAAVIYNPSLVKRILSKKETRVDHVYKGEIFLVYLVKQALTHNKKVAVTLIQHASNHCSELLGSSHYLLQKAEEMNVSYSAQFQEYA